MAETKDQAAEAQQTFFRITDNVPEEAWYWAALGSIGISALLKLCRQGRLGHLRRTVAADLPAVRTLPPLGAAQSQVAAGTLLDCRSAATSRQTAGPS